MPKTLRFIFSKLWTVWCALTFVILASIFYLTEFLLLAMGETAIVAAHRWPAFCTRLLLSTWGIRVKQHNEDLLRGLPQCVIVINHRCDLDALLATGYMPGMYKFIGKKELENYPFIGMLVRTLYITVDRANHQSKKQSLQNMQNQVAKGAHIVVFPEGWSNFSNDYLLELKRGAFKVALDGQLPILVCTFIGTHELFPKPKVEVLPGTVNVFWEALLPTAGLSFEKDEEQIRQKVEDIFLARLKNHYPDGYSYPADQMNFEEWRKKQLSNGK